MELVGVVCVFGGSHDLNASSSVCKGNKLLLSVNGQHNTQHNSNEKHLDNGGGIVLVLVLLSCLLLIGLARNSLDRAASLWLHLAERVADGPLLI